MHNSNIDIYAGVSTLNLKLRMQDSAKDPTCIYLSESDKSIKLAEGHGSSPNNYTLTIKQN